MIAWLAPAQPVRTDAGAIGSVQVNWIVSPVVHPAAVPLTLLATMSEPAGVWLSTMSWYVEPVTLTPALSVVMTRTLYAPSATVVLSVVQL